MACIQLYFQDQLKAQFKLTKKATSIGRTADNDIQIDNPGVSGLHAQILLRDEGYYLEDLDSKNGVFVNGQPVQRQLLEFGDTIQIFKHTLKFVAFIPEESHQEPEKSVPVFEQNATIAVNRAQLNQLLNLETPAPVDERQRGVLRLLSQRGDWRSYPLTRLSFSIGRKISCDIRTKGWFAPAVELLIKVDGNKHWLIPQARSKVKLNGVALKEPALLSAGDHFSVRNLTLEFALESL